MRFCVYVAASACLVLAPAAVAAPRDIPARDLPGEYVATVQEPGQFTFVDVKNAERAEGESVRARVYMVEAKPDDQAGKPSPFQAYSIRYDCAAGSMKLDHVDYVDADFGLIATLMAPPDFQAWPVSEKPDLADAWGFYEICPTGKAGRPRMGQGKTWLAIAAAARAKLSPQ